MIWERLYVQISIDYGKKNHTTALCPFQNLLKVFFFFYNNFITQTKRYYKKDIIIKDIIIKEKSLSGK